MDKYEIEQFEQIKELAANLQACFIDDDAYSRTPTPHEWRNAGRIVRQLTLACYELTGYAKAKRCIELDFVRQNLHVVKNETPPGTNPTAKITPLPTLEEINAMLVELNIKLNARQRADGLFEIRPSIGGVRKSFYGKTAEELAKKYNDYLNEKPRKKDRTKGGMFYYDWLDEWCEVYKKPNVAINTYKNITRCVNKHIKSHLKNKPLNRYSMTEITQALNEIESTRMRKYTRGILQDSFQCAVTVGKLRVSPAANLLPVKHVAKNGQAFNLNELNEMILNVSDKVPRALFLYYVFCLFAGTRRDEALGVRGRDCDFKNRIIYIHGTKTESSDRRIPMFPILEKILIELNTGNDDKIFKISPHRTNADFKIFRMGKDEAVLHWLRHTFGTIQICVLGIPANTVALWLGHADPSTTMDIYTHPENLAPDIYFSGNYSEEEKVEILKKRYNNIISTIEKFL